VVANIEAVVGGIDIAGPVATKLVGWYQPITKGFVQEAFGIKPVVKDASP
jgi:hypothetical protein